MNDIEFNATPGRQEVIITRTIHAPRDLVFRTVTDPLLIPKWWGPRNSSTAVHKMLVMPGGIWRFVQQTDDGKEYAFHGVYHEVVIPERLIYTSEFEGTPGQVTLYNEEFTERNGETIMKTIVVFQSVEDRDQKLQWGMEAGITESTSRLNELLGKENIGERKETTMEQLVGNEECITITRTFDAPRELVWERWTDPSQYMCWWGPKDFTAPYARLDPRPGGKYLSCMRAPDGKEYWDTGTYEEIDEFNRIVYTDTFADEHGNVVPPSFYGMGSDEPLDMTVEVRLEDIGGKTRLTLETCGLPGGEMIEQAKEGWNQSLDKLAECLG